MPNEELQRVLRAVRNLSPQEKQIVAKLLQADVSPVETAQPGANDGNADSEPSSDVQ